MTRFAFVGRTVREKGNELESVTMLIMATGRRDGVAWPLPTKRIIAEKFLASIGRDRVVLLINYKTFAMANVSIGELFFLVSLVLHQWTQFFFYHRIEIFRRLTPSLRTKFFGRLMILSDVTNCLRAISYYSVKLHHIYIIFIKISRKVCDLIKRYYDCTSVM